MGCVYKITSKNSDKCYIGSTTQKYLSHRISEHRCHYRRWVKGLKVSYCSSFELLELGVDDIEYEVIEELKETDDRKERESYWILQNDSVNILKLNHDKKEYNKQYREKNREEINAKQKEYHENNREQINAKNREKIPCDICNKFFNRSYLNRHKKNMHSDKK